MNRSNAWNDLPSTVGNVDGKEISVAKAIMKMILSSSNTKSTLYSKYDVLLVAIIAIT